LVVIYTPRLLEVVAALRRLPAARTQPLLQTVGPGHLAGLAIAHEVGHGLGLPHRGSGVMKAEPAIFEILELRAGRLGFAAHERSRMHLSLARQVDGVFAVR
jgi:hypothetical protein